MKDFKFYILIFIASMTLSCEEIIEVPDISNHTVLILAPLEGSELNNNQVNFNWDPLNDADQYRFQIAKPNFEEAEQILVDSLIDAQDSLNTNNYFNYEFISNGNYQWRVKAINSAFETEFTSANFYINSQ